MMRAILIAAITFLGVATQVAADYRVQPGDVLEVSISGLDIGGHKLPVQMDGSITVPRAGTVEVAGGTLAEVRKIVQTLVSSKVLRLRSSDGREYMLTVEPDEVAVAIVEYRPVFVTGSVTRPGLQTYRPLMTVRQALSAAGGQITPPQAASAIALQSDYVSTWLKLAAQHARTWRLRAELGEEVEFSAPGLAASPVAPSVLASMLDHERKLRKLRQDDIERRREHLAAAIAQADEQIATLTEQHAKEQEGANTDAAELTRATTLLGKGAVTYTRVLESRRTVLLSSTRALQTSSQLMQVKRARGEMGRQIDEIDDVRSMEVVRDLLDAELALNTERERLTRIGEQLALAGLEAPRAGSAQGPSIVVHRRAHDGTRTSMEANMETELAPGDVVEVSFPVPDSAVESALPDRSVPVVNAVTTTGAARQ